MDFIWSVLGSTSACFFVSGVGALGAGYQFTFVGFVFWAMFGAYVFVEFVSFRQKLGI